MLLGSVIGMFLQAVRIKLNYICLPSTWGRRKAPVVAAGFIRSALSPRRISRAFQSQCGVLLNTLQLLYILIPLLWRQRLK